MRATPFNLQGKGVLLEAISTAGKWKKESGYCESTEPTSVLDTRRSPSPPTSFSTLSSSLGGVSGSSDSASVAAVSDNPPHKWLPSQDDSSSAAAAAAAAAASDGSGSSGGSRKDEWATELQPIPASLEISGGDKCSGGGGLGMEDWENMLSETAASPGNEQSFFRWFGDLDDPSLKQLLQSGGGGGGSGGGTTEFETGGGFGLADPGFGFESVGSVSSSMNVKANAINLPPPVAAVAASAAAADFPLNSGNRLLPVQSPTPNFPNFKGSCFGSSNNLPSTIFSPSANTLPLPLPLPLSLPPGGFYQQQQLEAIEEKPQLFNTQHVINHQQSHPPQNPSFFLPLTYSPQEQQHLVLPPQSKSNHHLDPVIPKMPFSNLSQELFLRRQQQQQQQQQSFSNLHLISPHLQQRPMKPKVEDANHHQQQQQHHHQQQQQQVLVDQLFKAAELVENGNSVNARGILARLNHLSPVGKPFQRAAFYFKEALQLVLNTTNTPPSPRPLASPFDVVFKIAAYKAFSEISPFLQFTNFTSNQALLEALDGFNCIHIVDFDIGLGGQWASFMQELALKLGGPPSLKITAFASRSSHDPLELSLTRENLSHFASDLSIPFEFNVINIESFDPSSAILGLSDSEAVAVNLPVASSGPSIAFLLRLVKQLGPKIVVSVDRGSDRSELSFSQHFLHALHSYSILLDSFDAVNVNSDTVHKIERFLLQPRIENLLLGRHRPGEKLLPWRALFASAGFSPVPFSNFTETQAECLVKRLQVRGFHVEKRQASLYLCWQRGDLVSVSAWRC